jgi:hypothetical protein
VQNATQQIEHTEDEQEQTQEQYFEAKYNKCIFAIKDANVSHLISLYNL